MRRGRALTLRRDKSQPLLQSLHQWLLVQRIWVLPKSPIAAAINYVLNQWEALNRYTTDGDLHIDNNISERTLKLIGIGRNNWLFLGSDNGGRTAAVLFSFTATCKHWASTLSRICAMCSSVCRATRRKSGGVAAAPLAGGVGGFDEDID